MKLRILPIVFLALFISLQVTAQQPEVKFIADTLVVQAEGSFESDPDLAILAFDISAQEKVLKDAYSKASQSLQSVITVAERNGLSKDAVETGVLTVTPFYGGDRNRKARAYRVEGHVTLKVRDFAKSGQLWTILCRKALLTFAH